MPSEYALCTCVVTMCWRGWTLESMVKSGGQGVPGSPDSPSTAEIASVHHHTQLFHVCWDQTHVLCLQTKHTATCNVLPASVPQLSRKQPFPYHRHPAGCPVCPCCHQPNHPHLQWLHGPHKPRLSHQRTFPVPISQSLPARSSQELQEGSVVSQDQAKEKAADCRRGLSGHRASGRRGKGIEVK